MKHSQLYFVNLIQLSDWKLITEILISVSNHVIGLQNNYEIMALKKNIWL